MKSVKLVSMLGAIGTFLAAGVATAATTESLMQQREGVAAEQNAKKLQDFQAALPARIALVNSVIDQFRAEFARDSVNGAKRLNQFAQQVHSTPSSVLQVTRFSRNVAEFADRTKRALADPNHAKALGGNFDLVFFPMGPCRIADSRIATAGILSNGVARGYKNFSDVGQGGDAGCNVGTPGILSGSDGSIAMNIAATTVSGTGNLNARPVGASNTVSSLNFNPSQDISNATTIKMTGGGAAFDFEILPTVNGIPGTVDVVIDLLGFYVPNEPTALECTTTGPATTNSSITGLVTLGAPACAAGYTRTGTFCGSVQSTGADLQSIGVSGSFNCEWNQTVATPHNYQARSQCCRVPGNASGRI